MRNRTVVREVHAVSILVWRSVVPCPFCAGPMQVAFQVAVDSEQNVAAECPGCPCVTIFRVVAHSWRTPTIEVTEVIDTGRPVTELVVVL